MEEVDPTLKTIIKNNLELFEPIIESPGFLCGPTDTDKQHLKELFGVLYNDDEGKSLLEQYPDDIQKFVTD